ARGRARRTAAPSAAELPRRPRNGDPRGDAQPATRPAVSCRGHLRRRPGEPRARRTPAAPRARADGDVLPHGLVAPRTARVLVGRPAARDRPTARHTGRPAERRGGRSRGGARADAESDLPRRRRRRAARPGAALRGRPRAAREGRPVGGERPARRRRPRDRERRLRRRLPHAAARAAALARRRRAPSGSARRARDARSRGREQGRPDSLSTRQGRRARRSRSARCRLRARLHDEARARAAGHRPAARPEDGAAALRGDVRTAACARPADLTETATILRATMHGDPDGLVAENTRLAKEVRELRARIAALESSRWWRLHPRFLLRRTREDGEPAPDEVAGHGALPLDFDETDAELYNRVAGHTMTPPPRIYALARAVEYVVARGVPGAIVECGVWRGGSMMAAALTLRRLGATNRELFLFDTFAGMTPAGEED